MRSLRIFCLVVIILQIPVVLVMAAVGDVVMVILGLFNIAMFGYIYKNWDNMDKMRTKR